MADGVAGTGGDDRSLKPATAARMYDYYLGGVHNFPADRKAAEGIIAVHPSMPAAARANRAFLRRAVRYFAEAGVQQFLDLGSGMPTIGNVHEIAQQVTPEARVVYVDIDPVAVAESMQILGGNTAVAAIHGDMRQPQQLLQHPQVRRLLDFDQPIGLLLVAVLHFLPDNAEAYDVVEQLIPALAPGSYLAVSHGAAEPFAGDRARTDAGKEVYRRQTATPVGLRTKAEVERFFAGTKLVDPGIVWVPQWRPAPDDPQDFADDPGLSSMWAGVGTLT